MDPLTAQHRKQQLALRAMTVRQLQKLWPALDARKLDETFPGWSLGVAGVVRDSRNISAALASRYLREMRQKAGIEGLPPLATVEPVPEDALVRSLLVTGPVAIKSATGRGVPLARAVTNAFVLSSGAATRHVLDAGRDTVRLSLAQDKRAAGWQRVTGAKSCQFCQTLASRGGVYKADTAEFASHDHCGCTAEPVYR